MLQLELNGKLRTHWVHRQLKLVDVKMILTARFHNDAEDDKLKRVHKILKTDHFLLF